MKHHLADDKMSVVALDEAARRWAGELEEREARRSGVSRVQARRIVARRTGLAPGTLENIKNRRTKGVRGWVSAFFRLPMSERSRMKSPASPMSWTWFASASWRLMATKSCEMEAQRTALRELVG